MADQTNSQQNRGGKGKNPNRLTVVLDSVTDGLISVHAVAKDDINKPINGQEVSWFVEGVQQAGSNVTDNNGKTPVREFKIPAGTKTLKVKARIAGGPHDEVTVDVTSGSPKAKPKAGNLQFIYEIVAIGDGKYRVKMNLVDLDNNKAPVQDEIELSCDRVFIVDGDTIHPDKVRTYTIPERGVHKIMFAPGVGKHKIDVSIVRDPSKDVNIDLPGKSESPLRANLDDSVQDILFRGFQ